MTRPTFTPVRLREGYDAAEVDAFLDEVEPALGRRQVDPGLAERIAASRFTPRRLFTQAYDMGEVDTYLVTLKARADGATG